jgi:pimeloyl-ACP methyl ester carboxylesterase
MKRLASFGLLFTVGLLVVFGGLSGRSSQVTAATAAATEPGLGTPGPAQPVRIKAADGLPIVGLFYPSALSGRTSPAALLLHQINGSKAQWQPLIPALLAEGYSALAVDLRGFGETGGEINWKKAEGDVATLLAWLRDQPSINGDEIAIIGASIGANLAIRGCASDAQCRVVVALSPGLEYFGLTTGDAIRKMGKKAPLLVAGQIDTASAQAVKQLAQVAPGNVMIRVYDSGKHGIQLFDYDDLIPMIVQWLRSYNQAP